MFRRRSALGEAGARIAISAARGLVLLRPTAACLLQHVSSRLDDVGPGAYANKSTQATQQANTKISKGRQSKEVVTIQRRIISFVEQHRGAEAAELLLQTPVPQLDPSSVAAVLHACSALDELRVQETCVGDRSVVNTVNTTPLVNRIINEVVRCDERFWTESVLSQWLRQQCAAGDWDSATQTVSFLRTKFGPVKKRSFSPYLRLACNLRKRAYAEAIVRESAVVSPTVELDDEDVQNLAAMYVALGEPLSTLHGLLSLVSPYLSHLSRETADILWDWKTALSSGAQREAGVVDGTASAPSLSRGRANSTAAPPRYLAVTQAGVCPSCGSQLVGFPFTAAWKARLLEDIDKAVRTIHRPSPTAAGGQGAESTSTATAVATKKKTMAKDPVRHEAAVRSFLSWKRFVTSSPIMRDVDVLIDGANVGYYGLSSWYGVVKAQLREFRAAHFPSELRRLHSAMTWSKTLPYVDVPVSMDMIMEAVRVTTERGWKPLVLLHERHVEKHNLFPSAEAAVSRLREQSQLYTTPAGLNDDLCWLYGAVCCTTPTDDVPATGPAGGDGCERALMRRRRVFILTNDKMRDHHFRFLSPKPFSSWRNRHRVGFRCVREDGVTRMELEEPPTFTETLQHDPLTQSWHIPIAKRAQDDFPSSSSPSTSSCASLCPSRELPTALDDKMPLPTCTNAIGSDAGGSGGLCATSSQAADEMSAWHFEAPSAAEGLAAEVTEWLCLQ